LGRLLPGLLDLKVALRAARATPLLSLTAIGALSVGIGLSTAAFTIVKAVFYSQLRTTSGDPILALEDYDRAGGWSLPITLEELERRRAALTTFSDVAAYTQRASAITLAGQDEVRQVGFVTTNLFRLLGVAPMTGRDFGELEQVRTGGDVTLIGEGLARQRFQSPGAALGQILRVDGQPYTIVGVIPGWCRFPFDADVWVALVSTLPSATSPAQAVKVVARARPNVPMETAEAELVSVASRLPPVRGEERAQRVVPFGALASGPEAQSVGWSIVGALVMLLLVSAANVANLLLARAAARQRELTVRVTLGASRSRLVAGLVMEAAVLGSASAVFGFIGAGAALTAFKSVIDDLPYWVTLRPDATVAVFVIGIAALASLSASVGPALRVTRGSPMEAWRRSHSTIRFGRLSTALIVSETALAIGLLAGAALLGRGLAGFGYQGYRLPEDRLLIAQLYFGVPATSRDPGASDPPAWSAAWQKYLTGVRADQRLLVDRLSAVPGIRLAGYGWQFPGSERFNAPVEIDRPGEASEMITTRVAQAGENFFALLNASVTRGRDFTSAERENGAAVAIVNEPFVRRYFRDLNPIGQRVKVQRLERSDEWREVVGTVPDLALNPGDPARGDGVYVPAPPDNVTRLAVLVDGRPERFVPVIHDLARGLPLRPQVQWTRTLGAQMAQPIALFRGLGAGLIALGAVALVLACTGIHAIVAFSLTQRRREIAVRIALGAGAATLARALLSQTLRQLALGAVGGALVTVLVTRVMDTIPFDLPRGDVSVLFVMTLVLLGAGILACAAPLKKALALRPLDWLKEG
jgi:predicted permease